MKSIVFWALLLTSFGSAFAQNRKPKIVSQDRLEIQEDQSINILMTYLDVDDPDDWFYPWGFTMKLYPGTDYSLNGNIVTPAAHFNGVLIVPVTVNDGADDSDKFELKITVNAVNDKPVITGHTALSISEGQSIEITKAHLQVSDPDNKYPDDFTLKVSEGSNYKVEGSRVTPNPNFAGTLSVNVSVNDGQLNSDVYLLPIEVKAVVRVPIITGQSTLQVNEDETLTILLSHLQVQDEDSPYPTGFTLAIGPGENYTFSGTTIAPVANFSGKLSVAVTVNDGKNVSKPFNLAINVTPVNDAPEISGLEVAPLNYTAIDSEVPVTSTAIVSDIDGDSIAFAEISLARESYQIGVDKLNYNPPAGSAVRGVFDPNSGVLTLLGQASPSTYSKAIQAVTYEGIPLPPDQSKVLRFSVNDGKINSPTVERLIGFGAVAVALEIPSGFTPNGDQVNDTWKIVPLKSDEAYGEAAIKVYNKNGVLVYESVGFEREWDGSMNGQPLPSDTYFYTIDLNITAPEGFVKGVVTILR